MTSNSPATLAVPLDRNSVLSPSETLTDLQAEKELAKDASSVALDNGSKFEREDTITGDRRDSKGSDTDSVSAPPPNSLSSLPPFRKNVLLLCFVSTPQPTHSSY